MAPKRIRKMQIVTMRLYSAVSLLLLAPQTLASWIDPDTERVGHYDITSHYPPDNRTYHLVFSDEFEEPGRTFHDGNDPRWTAINKNDYTNAALHFYSPENALTVNGSLSITTERKVNTYKAFDEKKKTFYADKKHIQSAMLQSWNKFCFIGGIFEVSAKLPGHPEKGGLWPAVWMLGNLARATYVGSSDFMWPYSYSKCDAQNRRSQEINACSRINHFGMEEFRGRGSPEIDILETMQGEPGKLPSTFIERPYQSASLQIAPGIEIDRPILGKKPHKGHWYDRLEYSPHNMSDLNPFFYGVTLYHPQMKHMTYQSDAISANFQLDKDFYKDYHNYRIEWEPADEDGTGGYIKWYTDGELVHSVEGSSLDIMDTEIPTEPMYLIMNTAVSSSWGFPTPCPDNCDCDCFECDNPRCACALPSGYCDNFPSSFDIDYVRIYQAKDDPKHILGCSPEHRPTEKWIEGHAKRFMAAGQKVMLEDVSNGGGLCTKSLQCGSKSEMGSCASGACVCKKGFTGPHCRSHDGFYDVDTRKQTTEFALSSIMIPHFLIVVVACFVLGFAFSMLQTIRVNAKRPMYQVIGDAPISGSVNSAAHPPITSYQDSNAVYYAIPEKKKDRTYCVIDDRLVGDKR